MNKYQQLIKDRDAEQYEIFNNVVPYIPDLRLRNIKSEIGRLSLSSWDPWKALYEELNILDDSQSRGNNFDSDFLFYVTTYNLGDVDEETNNLRNSLFENKILIKEFFYTYPVLSWILINQYQGARQFVVYVGSFKQDIEEGILDQVLNLRLSDEEFKNLLLFIEDILIIETLFKQFKQSVVIYTKILNEAILLNALPYFKIISYLYFNSSMINLLIRLNRVEIITIVIKKNSAFCTKNTQTMTLLVEAACSGNVEILDILRNNNKLLNRGDFRRLIDKAINCNQVNVIKYLLNIPYPTRLQLDSDYKGFYLTEAVKNNNNEMLQLFLEIIPGKITNSNYLMKFAIEVESLPIIKTLLNAGLNPYQTFGIISIGRLGPNSIVINENYLTYSIRYNFDIFQYLIETYELFDLEKILLFLLTIKTPSYLQALTYLLHNYNFNEKNTSRAIFIANEYSNYEAIEIIKTYTTNDVTQT